MNENIDVNKDRFESVITKAVTNIVTTDKNTSVHVDIIKDAIDEYGSAHKFIMMVDRWALFTDDKYLPILKMLLEYLHGQYNQGLNRDNVSCVNDVIVMYMKDLLIERPLSNHVVLIRSNIVDGMKYDSNIDSSDDLDPYYFQLHKTLLRAIMKLPRALVCYLCIFDNYRRMPFSFDDIISINNMVVTELQKGINESSLKTLDAIRTSLLDSCMHKDSTDPLDIVISTQHIEYTQIAQEILLHPLYISALTSEVDDCQTLIDLSYAANEMISDSITISIPDYVVQLFSDRVKLSDTSDIIECYTTFRRTRNLGCGIHICSTNQIYQWFISIVRDELYLRGRRPDDATILKELIRCVGLINQYVNQRRKTLDQDMFVTICRDMVDYVCHLEGMGFTITKQLRTEMDKWVIKFARDVVDGVRYIEGKGFIVTRSLRRGILEEAD